MDRSSDSLRDDDHSLRGNVDPEIAICGYCGREETEDNFLYDSVCRICWLEEANARSK